MSKANMATRDGHKIGQVLVEHYGWGWGSRSEPDYYGDRRVVCPRTGEEFGPHNALAVQIQRCDGETADDSPLRHLDPRKWAALRACEFAETVPYDQEQPHEGAGADAMCHLAQLARYCREKGVL